MDIGSILLILGLLLLVALYLSKPLMERTSTLVSDEEHEYSALLAERDRILNALQELDFDYTLGKIPEESYPIQRESLLQHGAAILRQIDKFHGEESTDVNERLEAAIEARRIEKGRDEAPTLEDDDLEELIAMRRRERSEKSIGFCSQCGNPLLQSDRFCPKCGTPLS